MRNSTQAEALALRGEYIVAVGSSAEIKALAGADTREIELGGAHWCCRVSSMPMAISLFGKVRPERSGAIPSRWG